MRVSDARGGTNRIGVPAGAFAMPEGMRMRYDVPSAGLAELVTGYAIYISDSREPMINWFLPSPAIISITLDAGQVDVSNRNRVYHDIDQVTLYGPTSRAFQTVTHGGIAIGIGLTALGWSRLTSVAAVRHLDRLAPLSEVVEGSVVTHIVAALLELDDDARLAPTLDDVLVALFGSPGRNDDRVRELTMQTLTEGNLSVADLAERLGIRNHTLRKVSTDAFGLTPKLLLSRARFLRSMIRWILAGEPPSYLGMDSSYHDISHFLRDAKTYLGGSPRQFVASHTVYLRASLEARAAVMGAPAPALHVGTVLPPLRAAAE